MYRTDKLFMKDPSTASARIYIGNIAESVVADNLEQKFRIHGNILGLVLQRGFGFIQFENEHQAKLAIQHEHGVMFHGRKLNVKQAFAHPNQAPPNKQFGYHQPNNQYGNQPPNNEYGNNQYGNHPPPNQFRNQQRPPPQNFERQEPEPPRPVPPQQDHQNKNVGPQQQHTPNTGPLQQKPNMGPQQQKPQQQQPLQSPQKNQPPPQQHHQNVQQQQRPPQNVQQQQQRPPPNMQPQQPPQNVQQRPPQNTQQQKPPHEEPYQEPPMGGEGGPPEESGGNQMDAGGPPVMGRGGPPIGRGGPPMGEPLMGGPLGGGGPLDRRGKKRRRGIGRDRDLDMHGLPKDYRNSYYGRDDYGPNYPPMVDSAPERNDCEIIVVSKALTEYAEYIEQRLKSLGLIVDLLFPNEDVPIGRVLANISSRGCLYAILIMPQNEEHRSLTLDILHGIPQEHRNMPIEDAFILITRNFDAYMRGEQTGRNTNGTGVNSLSERHPEGIQMILNLLAENRQITTAQYDRLIKYLLQRRDLQSEHEISESRDAGQEEPTSKQAELQNRILNILNKSSEEAKPVAVPVPAPATSTPPAVTPTPLLNDPSVQKALDSLLLGDMFKSIGSTA